MVVGYFVVVGFVYIVGARVFEAVVRVGVAFVVVFIGVDVGFFICGSCRREGFVFFRFF